LLAHYQLPCHVLQDNSHVVCCENLQDAASTLRIIFLLFIEHAKTYDTIATPSFNTMTEGQHMNSPKFNNKDACLMLNVYKRSYWLPTIAEEAKTSSSLSLAKF